MDSGAYEKQNPTTASFPVFIFYKGVGEVDTRNYFIFHLLYFKALE